MRPVFFITPAVSADAEARLRSSRTSRDKTFVLAAALIGIVVQLASILIQSVAIAITVRLVSSLFRRGLAGTSFLRHVVIMMAVMYMLLTALLAQVALWALAFVTCGALPDFGTAFYHSAVNFTTLGYGDIVMPPPWRLLGPFEAANGVLMFGLSASAMFAVTSRLLELRFKGQQAS
jgi:hypothetical protein